jgi:hypothetical protein
MTVIDADASLALVVEQDLSQDFAESDEDVAWRNRSRALSESSKATVSDFAWHAYSDRAWEWLDIHGDDIEIVQYFATTLLQE